METITESAIRHPFTSQIATGVGHYEAWMNLFGADFALEWIQEATRLYGEDETNEILAKNEGFLTSLGRFVSRAEAYEIALIAKQTQIHESGQLTMEDIA